jgi:hypothetical protein
LAEGISDRDWKAGFVFGTSVFEDGVEEVCLITIRTFRV